ncbi:MAG: UTP--glucose-1-phosphate uridylyltransferase, partial [Mariniphaga sp.]|nr:UTP--glucose-1-phosphate uridylyltransferase [Mariniphaga sp.]
FIWQKEMNGLGDAIKLARYHVNNEPFAILLGDTLVDGGDVPVTKQLIKVYEKYGGPVVALEQVKPELVSRYGVIDGELISENILKANNWIEKPTIEQAPSNLAVASRYIFTPEIFSYLDKIGTGINNEVQLTDAMKLMVKEHPMYGLIFKGKRYDIGNKLGFLKTNLIYSLKDPEISDSVKSWLKEFARELED